MINFLGILKIFFISLCLYFLLFSYAYCNLLLIEDSEDSLVYYVDNKSDFNILINCSVHGDEDLPYNVIKEFLDKKYFEKDFSYANYIIVLEPSKYRIQNKTRYSLEKIDPNRTYITLFSKSSKLILNLLNDYDIDFIIDLHEAVKRDNIDFMYYNGFYSKFLLKFFKTYNIIYNQYDLNKLISIENRIVINQEEIFKNLYEKYNIRISKYYVNNDIGGYDYASILRNYGIIRNIPTILFETVNKENKEYFTKKVYYDFLNNLKNYLFLLKEYKNSICEIQNSLKVYYLFNKNYDNIDILMKYLKINKINYYYYEKFENLDKVSLIEYNINDISLNLDNLGMKGLFYINFEIYQNQISDKKIIAKELSNSIIIPFNLLVYYLLDPNSKESLFNFNILPLNYYKLKKLPSKILIYY
ncbi:MAG: hypothetical protein ACP5O4_00815 [bacterium]